MKTLLKLALSQYFICILYIIDMYIYIYIYIYIYTRLLHFPRAMTIKVNKGNGSGE